MYRRPFIKLICLTLLSLGLLTGCEDDDERRRELNRGRDFQPAENMGAILFENDTSATWNLQIDGNNLGRVTRGTFSVRNYPAGEYRVRLDQHEGSDVKQRQVIVVVGEVSAIRVDGVEGDFDIVTFTVNR